MFVSAVGHFNLKVAGRPARGVTEQYQLKCPTAVYVHCSNMLLYYHKQANDLFTFFTKQ